MQNSKRFKKVMPRKTWIALKVMIDINECTNGQANCASVEICVNTEGGYRCECPPNWELDSRRQRCVPIRNNQHFPQGYGNEPTYNAVRLIHYGTTGRPSKPEVNVVEDRVNKCPAGYEVGDDNLCHDVDECLTGEAKCGLLQRGNNQGVITLVKSLEGPQSIELELSMELYNRGQFAGIAVAKLYIYVSEYEF
ncbi:Fibulin-7 [Papilio machaon]|uniref:Fibulin-7 n=1 Tax=Papilio machaon TaxID=76193 RepID=A0A194R4Y7_PAPMA|nr:Fibulin-7 [Papilio machaon]